MGDIVQDNAPVADGLEAVKARLEDFGREVMAGAVNRPAQTANGGLYLRGLLEQGPRKSLEPICERLGSEADYQSMQQFLAVSPWDPAVVLRNVAERQLVQTDHLHLKRLIPSPNRDCHAHRIDPSPDEYFDTLLVVLC